MIPLPRKFGILVFMVRFTAQYPDRVRKAAAALERPSERNRLGRQALLQVPNAKQGRTHR